MNKLIRNGKVGVLVSGGFGAGWSSWNSALGEFLAMDATLIELKERGASDEEVEAYIKATTNDAYIYMGGWADIEIEWVPVGTQFVIEEYDGSESLTTIADKNWFTA